MLTESNSSLRTESIGLLQTHNLTLGYKTGQTTNLLFENLNLTLLPGQLVCFMGPNGIGKSTLIRTLAGLQKPLSGRVSLPYHLERVNQPDGLPSPSGRRAGDVGRPAVVLTDRITANTMTVRDLVTFGRYPFLDWNIKLKEEDKAIIDRSIGQVQIQHLALKKLYELSDGQMQMTMIARALAQDTSILLLDEPTAHLDLNNRLEIMNLLRKISRIAGKAILMATHELDLALQTADLIWLATLSKTIKSGLPEDLVLDGSFDEVFQFKGFDLKTGKVDHEAHLGISINLKGQGHEYLWTKNALERNGFEIASTGITEIVIENKNALSWTVSGNKKFNTLFDLLVELKKI